MTTNKINDKIIHFDFQTKKELNLTFHRIQEFYESPYTKIKGKYFTGDQFIDLYSDDEGNLSYFSFWEGINLPIRILQEFNYVFENELSKRECNINSELIKNNMTSGYIIGTVNGCPLTMRHEISHAMFHLFSEYKQKCTDVINSIPPEISSVLYQNLLDIEYSEEVLIDELVAYMIAYEHKEWEEIFPLIDFKDLEGWTRQLEFLNYTYNELLTNE